MDTPDGLFARMWLARRRELWYNISMWPEWGEEKRSGRDEFAQAL